MTRALWLLYVKKCLWSLWELRWISPLNSKVFEYIWKFSRSCIRQFPLRAPDINRVTFESVDHRFVKKVSEEVLQWIKRLKGHFRLFYYFLEFTITVKKFLFYSSYKLLSATHQKKLKSLFWHHKRKKEKLDWSYFHLNHSFWGRWMLLCELGVCWERRKCARIELEKSSR